MPFNCIFLLRLFWYLLQWSGSISSIFCTRLYRSKFVNLVWSMEKKNSQEILNLDNVIYRELKSLVIQDGWTSTCPHPINWWQELHRKKNRFWLWSRIFFRSIGTQQIEQYWTCYLPRGMEKKPKIRIPQQQSGGFIRFFKKLFKYE